MSFHIDIELWNDLTFCLYAMSTKKSFPRAPFYPKHSAMQLKRARHSGLFVSTELYKGGTVTGSHESRLNELRVSVSFYYVAAIFCSSVKFA